MAETTYSYVGADFPDSKINPARFKTEIEASTIVTALARIDTSGGTLSEGVVTNPDTIDVVFKAALSSGDKTTLDGDQTGPAGGLIAAHDNSPTQTFPVGPDGTPKVSIYNQQNDGAVLVAESGRAGEEMIVSSHNFSDKTTWFSTSIRVTDEVLTDTGDGLTFELPSGSTDNKPWIDLVHGKVLWEDNYVDDYKIVVTVDDVLKTEDPMYGSQNDYSVDYVNGRITFHTSQAGSVVKASYSYANTSEFILATDGTKDIVLEDAEIQFSSDLSYNDCVRLGIWGYCVAFDPLNAQSNGGSTPDTDLVEIPLSVRRYQRHDQILDEARGAYPIIGSVGGSGGHASERYGYPLIYKTVTVLYAAYGMEFRVSLENDSVFGGERSTVTFYGIYRDPE